MIDEYIVKRLCTDIETDLRLQTLTDIVRQDERNPLKTTQKDLSSFLRLERIFFDGEALDIRTQVTHYLDTTFYNLTTVALHDWKTYGQMRSFAELKYVVRMGGGGGWGRIF